MASTNEIVRKLARWTGLIPEIKPVDPDALRLQCMEVWGGNHGVRTAVEVAGLDVWVECQPYEQSEGGGDIHYVSTCGSGRVSRFVLADVSGHGAKVSALAVKMRDLMRKHVNVLNMATFATELNRDFAAFNAQGRFATALLVTYFAPQDHLLVCNAGHPRPLWYHARSRRWHLLEPQMSQTVERIDGVRNLPLGVIEDTEYAQFAVKLEPGDFVVLYTDCLIESQSLQGRELGEEGLLELISQLPARNTKELSQALTQALEKHRGGKEACDDQTVMILHHNAGDPPAMMRLWGGITELALYLGLIDYSSR